MPYTPDVAETTDAAASTSIAYSLQVGETYRGTIDSAGDHDYIAVTLEAGKSYTISMVGTGALSQQLNDTLLRLRDAGGVQIAESDDHGSDLNSTITITPSTTGTYYINAGAWSSTATGRYSVSIVEGDLGSYDLEIGAGVLHRTVDCHS